MTTTGQQHNEPHATMSTSVSPPDLFGGSLFGDELIDMYNSDAVVGAEGEIPSLLPPHPTDETHHTHSIDPSNISHSTTSDLPVDDGLGAFLPSTSFNDLTSLLPPTPEATMPIPPNMVSSADISSDTPNSQVQPPLLPPAQKRTATVARLDNTNDATSNKRIHTNNHTGVTVDRQPLSHVAQSVVNHTLKSQPPGVQAKPNTPNPLTHTKQAAAKPLHSTQPARVSITPAHAPIRTVAAPRTVIKADSITSEAAAATAAAVAAATAAPVSAATEADFKSVAQAAVANLILNVAGGKEGPVPAAKDPKTAPPPPGSKAADTSTAHIRALTGNNWVAACSGNAAPAPAPTVTPAAATIDSKANRNRRQNLTPDERARQNRDRNREHARNTRLRKKAYVEELKRTLTEMVSQRDANEVEKRHTAQRELEQREVRFRVMEEFLKLRGRNELNSARWVAILEENFSLTLPLTDYRKMIDSGHDNVPSLVRSEQVLQGASEAMVDAGHLSSFLQTLGHGNETTAAKSPVSMQYHCDRKTFFMDGCTALLTWSASSVGAVNQGAPMEMTLRGNMTAKFSPASNKLISAEIMFDTGIVATQLQHFDAPKCEEDEHCDAVAAAAATKADAILDSLQMPQLGTAVPAAITVVPVPDGAASATVSITSTEKEEHPEENIDVSGKQSMKMDHSHNHAAACINSYRRNE